MISRAALRSAIGKRCPYCNARMTKRKRPPSRDHIRARSKGHTFEAPGNQAIVCTGCNGDKGSMSLARWLQRLEATDDKRAAYVQTFIRRRAALS